MEMDANAAPAEEGGDSWRHPGAGLQSRRERSQRRSTQLRAGRRDSLPGLAHDPHSRKQHVWANGKQHGSRIVSSGAAAAAA